jgi:hypothetical protein
LTHFGHCRAELPEVIGRAHEEVFFGVTYAAALGNAYTVLQEGAQTATLTLGSVK